jgi:hypothetical protein
MEKALACWARFRLAVVAITLAEALLLVRAYDRKTGVKSDGGQVLFAYGVANVAGGLSGALVSGPSASRSAAMDDAGAGGQFPSLVAAAAIALVVIFFTDELAALPTAALAGIVASAVLKLVEVGEFREFWHMRRSEFWVAAVCAISVLALGPLQAVCRRSSLPFCWPQLICCAELPGRAPGSCGKQPTAVIFFLRKQAALRTLPGLSSIVLALRFTSQTQVCSKKRSRA